jgi:hypothetical protein
LVGQLDVKRAIALQQTVKERDHTAEFLEMEEHVNKWNSQVASDRYAYPCYL